MCNGIILCVVMCCNRCSGVVNRVWGDGKYPMVTGTRCEVDYKEAEDWEAIG